MVGAMGRFAGLLLLVAGCLAGPATAAPPADPSVAEALHALRTGEPERALKRLWPLMTERRDPPSGAVSTWLAAGGLRSAARCSGTSECAVRRLVAGVKEPRVDPDAARRFPGEPRLLVMLAQDEAARGEGQRAAVALAMALKTPLPDEEAVRVARAWGWTVADAATGGLPVVRAEARSALSLGLALIIGLLLWLFGAGLVVWRGARSSWLLGAIALAALAGVGAWALLGTGSVVPQQPAAGAELVLEAPPSIARDAPAALLQARAEGERSWLGLGAAATATGIIALLALLVLALRRLWRVAATTAGRRWLVGGLSLAALAHALVPGRMVMVYTGYPQIQYVLDLEPLRYGPAGNWLHGVPLWLFGPGHDAVQWANRFFGLVSLIFLWSLATRLAPKRRSVALWAVALTIVTPLLLRDHTSESVLVAGMAFVLAALDALADPDRPLGWVLAVPCLVVAALARPEMMLAAGPLAGLVVARGGGATLRRHWPAAVAVMLAAGALLALHTLHLSETVDWLRRTDALPAYATLGTFMDTLVSPRNLTVTLWGPPLVLLGLVAAFFRRGDRWLCGGLLLVALAWMAFTHVDLPDISVPRVHAPPWLLLALVASFGLAELWQRASHGVAWGRAVLAVALVASLVVSGLRSFAPLNSDAEEDLLQATVATLPDEGRLCLTTVGYSDPPPPGKTHRYFPAYLFADRAEPVEQRDLSELPQLRRDRCTAGIWAILGMRCYMHLRNEEGFDPPPPGAEPIQA